MESSKVENLRERFDSEDEEKQRERISLSKAASMHNGAAGHPIKEDVG